MDNSCAKIRVAVFDQTVCVQIDGRANFASSMDLKKLITELWRHGYSHFSLDLCGCRVMDSTFVGVLSGICLQMADGKENPTPVELINPNPRIAESLNDLGVIHLFKIRVASAPLTDKYEALAKNGEAPTRVEVARTCLEAHKILMDLKPENVQKFKDVAQFLAEDLKRLELGEK